MARKKKFPAAIEKSQEKIIQAPAINKTTGNTINKKLKINPNIIFIIFSLLQFFITCQLHTMQWEEVRIMQTHINP